MAKLERWARGISCRVSVSFCRMEFRKCVDLQIHSTASEVAIEIERKTSNFGKRKIRLNNARYKLCLDIKILFLNFESILGIGEEGCSC